MDNVNFMGNGTKGDASGIGSTPIALDCVRIFLGLAAIVGNSLIVHCMIRYELLRTATNIVIGNLAASDCINGIALVFNAILRLTSCGGLAETFGWKVAKSLLKVTAMTGSLGNSWSVFYIALERFISVHLALRYNSIVTEFRVKIVLSLTWFCNMMISVLLFVLGDREARVTVLAISLNGLLLCSFFLYVYIARVAFKKSRQILPQPHAVIDGTTAESRANEKNQWKVTKFFALVFGVCVFCYVVWLVLMYVTDGEERENCSHSGVLEFVGYVLSGFNICINPFLYAWRSQLFRSCLKRRLGLKNNRDLTSPGVYAIYPIGQ